MSRNLQAEEPCFEEIHPSSYKRKKRIGKKEEDLSGNEVTENQIEIPTELIVRETT